MISTPIYSHITEKAIANFRPTWLMIKQHKITGLKYFCKTMKKDPYKYKGSGTWWVRHIKKHGKKHGKKHVETLWCQLFDDIYELVDYALTFSRENDIAASKEWANLMLEDGLGGYKTEETRRNMSTSRTGKKLSEEHKQNIAIGQTGRKHTEETKKKIGNSHRGKKRSEEHKRNTGLSSKGRKWSEEAKSKIDHNGARNSNAKKWKISHENGEVVFTDCLKIWCQENGIPYCSIGLARKKGKSYKGWFLEYA
jgi:hypothetical protein